MLDTYANLILLCPTHHTLIDKNGGSAWPVGDVERIKADHEEAVDRAMSFSDLSTRDLGERTAARIELWESKLGIDSWSDVSFQLNQPTPILTDIHWRRLFETAKWLLVLDWPREYPNVADAFENHRLALWMLTQFLHTRMTSFRGDDHGVDDPHHRIDWDPPLYNRLLRERSVSCNGIWLLSMEVTRSINFVITAIRAEFDRMYRFDEGLVLLSDGDVIFGVQVSRVEYSIESRRLPADPDLSQFLSSLQSAVAAKDPRGGGLLDLAQINVGEWSQRPSAEG